VLHNQHHRLVKHAAQFFVGDQHRSGFDVGNVVRPAVLVNALAGLEQQRQFGGAHKRIFVVGHVRVGDNAANRVAVKNVLGTMRVGMMTADDVLLFRLKDAANGGAKEIAELSLFGEFLVVVVIVVVIVVLLFLLLLLTA